MHKRSTEPRGQALVIIAFGLIALIAVTALAVDGGSAYSDRRHAQNAADTSVMATGLTRIRNPKPEDWPIAEGAGFSRAADNGYDNMAHPNGASNEVHVYECTDPASSCNLPAGEDPENYVQVTITSTIPTFFARIVGMPAMTNSVQAIAKSVPPTPTPWYNGNALVATMPGCKTPGWPNDPFTLSGNSVSLVTGVGGVFVNSNCDPAFTSSSNTTMDSVAGICVVGGVNSDGNINPPPDDNCGNQLDLSLYQLPAVGLGSCPSEGHIYNLGGNNYVAFPGSYDDSFPNVSPAGTLKLQTGIYCLKGGISLSAGWTLTTDIDGVGAFDGSDGGEEGVLLYVPTGSVTFNGGSFIRIGAQNKPGTDAGIKGYLLYLPPTNNSPVKIAGGNGSTFIGTILAPSSLVTLEGGTATDSLNLECQIIGYSIRITGDGTLNIEYNQSQNGQTYNNPLLIPYK